MTLTDASWFQDVNDGIYKGIGTTGYSTVASATTPDIFATTVSGVINYTGTTTCTGFVAAPSAGARRTLICAGAAVFTAGANMLIDGVSSGSNLTCAANDKVDVVAISTTQFRLSRTAYAGNSVLTLGTLTATTSGTAIDFTGIPSTAKRIMISFNGVSTNGTSNLMIQIGGGSVETTSYNGYTYTPVTATTHSTGFLVTASNIAANLHYGIATLTLMDATTKLWAFSTTGGDVGSNTISVGGGSRTTTNTLDRVRITSVSADTFDAGSVNIMYE